MPPSVTPPPAGGGGRASPPHYVSASLPHCGRSAAGRQPVTGKFKLRRAFPLKTSRAGSIPVTEDPERLSFLFEASKKAFRVAAASQEEAAGWLVDAQACIAQCGGQAIEEAAQGGATIGGGSTMIQLEIVGVRVIEEEDFADKKHVVFEVVATDPMSGKSVTEEKRYSEIAALHKRLVKDMTGSPSRTLLPPLPDDWDVKNKVQRRYDQAFIDKRREKLEAFLIKVTANMVALSVAERASHRGLT
jgi:hypothetical protein